MGDYADMILDGDFCQSCGCYMAIDNPTGPGACEDCIEESENTFELTQTDKGEGNVQ